MPSTAETRTLPGLVGPLARRLTSMAKRIAVVFAAMDRTEHITAEQFQAAVAIVNYGVGSLLHCFGASTGDPDADRLLRAVRAARREGMSRTEIYDLFDRNLTAGEVNLMVERLVDAGLVVQAKVPTGRAPRRVVVDARLAGQP